MRVLGTVGIAQTTEHLYATWTFRLRNKFVNPQADHCTHVKIVSTWYAAICFIVSTHRCRLITNFTNTSRQECARIMTSCSKGLATVKVKFDSKGKQLHSTSVLLANKMLHQILCCCLEDYIFSHACGLLTRGFHHYRQGTDYHELGGSWFLWACPRAGS
jgi:hypothetical protein